MKNSSFLKFRLSRPRGKYFAYRLVADWCAVLGETRMRNPSGGLVDPGR